MWMKKCPACKEEINEDAKKCPKCQKDLRNWFVKHWVLSIIIVFIWFAIFGTNLEEKDENKIITNQLNNTSPNNEKIIEKAIIVSAKVLTKEYESNEVRADSTYKNKLAEITWKVKDIWIIFDQTYITLDSEKEFSFSNVQCFIENKDDIDKIATLNKKDYITIVWIIEWKSMNVEIKKCRIK